MTNYEIKTNEQHNSKEVYFAGKPNEETRTALKGLKMRWNKAKGCWYGFASEEEIKAACEGITVETTAPKTREPKKNKYGVQVGDIFEATWGYEQTNVNFFQVVELVGTSSVRVREVYPERIKEDYAGYNGMAADRTYKITKELLPAASSSVFIEDQEKGDLKRLKSNTWGDNTSVLFKLSSFCNASLITSDTYETYESWYY